MSRGRVEADEGDVPDEPTDDDNAYNVYINRNPKQKPNYFQTKSSIDCLIDRPRAGWISRTGLGPRPAAVAPPPGRSPTGTGANGWPLWPPRL